MCESSPVRFPGKHHLVSHTKYSSQFLSMPGVCGGEWEGRASTSLSSQVTGFDQL